MAEIRRNGLWSVAIVAIAGVMLLVGCANNSDSNPVRVAAAVRPARAVR